VCVRRSSPSNDPATVIFPACVGVREREFTPHSSEGLKRPRGDACTCEGENRHRVRCFCVAPCARVHEISAVAKPRSRVVKLDRLIEGDGWKLVVGYATRIPH